MSSFDTPLAKVGGKGLFVKELELAMLEGRADIAVHSMKDVPVEFPEGLGWRTICERDDPRDAFAPIAMPRLTNCRPACRWHVKFTPSVPAGSRHPSDLAIRLLCAVTSVPWLSKAG